MAPAARMRYPQGLAVFGCDVVEQRLSWPPASSARSTLASNPPVGTA